MQAEKYFKNHFQETLGKTFRPFEDKEIFSLALDKTDPKNDELLDKLRKNFYVVACPLGEVPTALIEQKRQELGVIDSPAAMDGGKFLTCLIRKEEEGEDKHNTLSKLYQLFYNHKTEGATYVMLNMPSGDISEAKYLLPIIDNGIDGYYNIETISFGCRTKTLKVNDVEMPVKLPTLRIKIGAFHPFSKRYTEGIVPHMANQIWNYSQLQKLINKTNSCSSTENGINLSVANEPEMEYESDKVSSEMDYIES